MKKYINKIMKLVLAIIIVNIAIVSKINALPYYDLRFEEVSTKTVKGEFEYLDGSIKLKKDTQIPIKITKSYEPQIDKELNKDEEDAISQCLGGDWRNWVVINKEEQVDIKKDKITYLQVRPIYKEIKGNLVKDYSSWDKSEEITILMPIDVEYTIKIQ